MPDIKVIKIKTTVLTDELCNLPNTLEVLYLPFFKVEEDKYINFPPSLKKIFIGPQNEQNKIFLKVPFLCEIIDYDYTFKNYYVELFRIENLFKEE